MIRFTHFFDAVYQLILTCIALAITGGIFLLVYPGFSQFEKMINWQSGGIQGWVLVVIVLSISFHILSRTLLPRALPTYLYLRLSLFIPASFADAKDVSFLFDGSTGSWHTLGHLRKIPHESRRQELLNFAQEIREEKSAIRKSSNWKAVTNVWNNRMLNWCVLPVLVFCAFLGWVHLCK